MSGDPFSMNPRTGHGDLPIPEQQFQAYLDSRDWRSGKTKHLQSYDAFLRAGSLAIENHVAFDHVVERIEAADGVLKLDKLRRQLQRAYDYIGSKVADGVTMPLVARKPKPTFCPQSLARVAAKVPVDDIITYVKARSPIPPDLVTSRQYLSHIFFQEEKVVTLSDHRRDFQHIWEAANPDRDGLPSRGEAGVYYLINPVDGEFHYNPRGKNRSCRSEEAITSWRHLLLESDEADPALWLKAVVQMPLRIRAIYKSGGNSIHSLVQVDAATKKEWDTIKDSIARPLITLGACKGSLTAVRLSRLPQAWRGDRLQELLYLDPQPDGTAISTKHLRLATPR